jgi:hypothetical protein
MIRIRDGSLSQWMILILLASYALAIHCLFIIRLPDPLIHPDTCTYLSPVLD